MQVLKLSEINYWLQYSFDQQEINNGCHALYNKWKNIVHNKKNQLLKFKNFTWELYMWEKEHYSYENAGGNVFLHRKSLYPGSNLLYLYTSVMKWQFVLTHTICQTESPTLLDSNVHTKIWLYLFYMIYLLTATGLTAGSSSTVHIYTQTMHRTTQWSRIPRTEHT